MEIKEFIHQTIDDVINGINEASLRVNKNEISIYMDNSPIEFDIAVTTISTVDSTKNAGLNKILVAGISKSEENQDKVVSRLKFSVTINIDNREKIPTSVSTGMSRRKNHY